MNATRRRRVSKAFSTRIEWWSSTQFVRVSRHRQCGLSVQTNRRNRRFHSNYERPRRSAFARWRKTLQSGSDAIRLRNNDGAFLGKDKPLWSFWQLDVPFFLGKRGVRGGKIELLMRFPIEVVTRRLLPRRSDGSF